MDIEPATAVRDSVDMPAGADTPRRVVITHVSLEVDGGRFAAKAVVGDLVTIEADIFLDGHDEVACVLQHRREGDSAWAEQAMAPLGNDRWRAGFVVEAVGRYEYRIEAWPDVFGTWRRDLKKRLDAGQDLTAELASGTQLVRTAGERAAGAERDRLFQRAQALLDNGWGAAVRAAVALEDGLAELMSAHDTRGNATLYDPGLAIWVERERARFGAWYEMFPRSASPDPARAGSFADCIARLPYVAQMGFDVLYLPPVHPIGRTNRKGANNSVLCRPGDPGSPWAIGSAEGGHKALDPGLGTLEDFRRLLAAASAHGVEVALDFALQCSPDHPYVKEHPEWFRRRPDGSVRYAENPPKKYEDIYPFDFECDDWRGLWAEAKSIVDFWVEQGVRIFRVDNPHTKPFAFWEWLIAGVRRDHPDVIFLSEAFTRPNVMYHLAKIGFSQSYTYFTWRNTKAELTEYFTELASDDVRNFFRPNLWPNTPDILHEYLQTGGRPAFIARFVLAATLGASYGIYGPPFELGEHVAREPGSEEYLNSEKYQVRHWDIDRPDSLRDVIARVNEIRRREPALRGATRPRFLAVDNEQLIAYAKRGPSGATIVVVVNLDPRNTQAGWIELPQGEPEPAPGPTFEVHDLLSDERYTWQGSSNFVLLDPNKMPAHILRVNLGASEPEGLGRLA